MQAETATKKPLFLREPQVKLCVQNCEAPEGGLTKAVEYAVKVRVSK